MNKGASFLSGVMVPQGGWGVGASAQMGVSKNFMGWEVGVGAPSLSMPPLGETSCPVDCFTERMLVLQCCCQYQLSFQGQFLVLGGKPSQGRHVDSQVLITIFLVLLVSYYALMIFLIMLSIILLCMPILILSTCDRASDLWQQLEFSEVEYDARGTVD